MKRRSPWLAFAACLLLRGSSARAEPEKPALSISKASAVAEAELEKRGFGGDHVIASVTLTRLGSGPAFYTARIEPPIPANAVKDAASPKDEVEKPENPSVALKIEMNGTVTLTQDTPRRRIRVLNTIPK
jgi:hypothetical protein